MSNPSSTPGWWRRTGIDLRLILMCVLLAVMAVVFSVMSGGVFLSPENLYNVACCYALCVRAVARGNPAQHITDDQKAIQADYSAHAIENLTRSVQHGFKDFDHMRNDTDLDWIRGHPGYKKLLNND